MQPTNFIGAAVVSQMADGLNADQRRKHVLVAALMPRDMTPIHAMVVHREAVAAATQAAVAAAAPVRSAPERPTPPAPGEQPTSGEQQSSGDPATVQAEALKRLANAFELAVRAFTAYYEQGVKARRDSQVPPADGTDGAGSGSGDAGSGGGGGTTSTTTPSAGTNPPAPTPTPAPPAPTPTPAPPAESPQNDDMLAMMKAHSEA